MSRKIVSIIVPIFNTQEYLCRCLESVQNQTYKNLEVILVNDGSSDCSYELCNNYVNRDPRFIVVDKKNGGVSSARNAGLEIASGEYITFLDSDDCLAKEAIAKLVAAAELYNVDISAMRYVCFSDECEFAPQDNKDVGSIVFKSHQYMQEICKRKQSEAVWNKLFKREVIGESRFELGKLNEDFLFLCKLLLKHDLSIAQIQYAGYGYYTRHGSISHSGFGKSLEDAVHNTLELQKTAKRCKLKNLEKSFGAYAAYQSAVSVISMTVDQYSNNQSFVEKCRKTIKQNFTLFVRYPYSNRVKLYSMLFLLCPNLPQIIKKRL